MQEQNKKNPDFAAGKSSKLPVERFSDGIRTVLQDLHVIFAGKRDVLCHQRSCLIDPTALDRQIDHPMFFQGTAGIFFGGDFWVVVIQPQIGGLRPEHIDALQQQCIVGGFGNCGMKVQFQFDPYRFFGLLLQRFPLLQITLLIFQNTADLFNIFIGGIAGGFGSAGTFHSLAEQIKFADILRSVFADINTFVWGTLQPAFVFQTAESLPHRRGADPQFCCQTFFAQRRTGRDLFLNDFLQNGLISSFGESVFSVLRHVIAPLNYYGIYYSIFQKIFKFIQWNRPDFLQYYRCSAVFMHW